MANSMSVRREFLKTVSDFRLHRLSREVAGFLAASQNEQLVRHLPRVHLASERVARCASIRVGV